VAIFSDQLHLVDLHVAVWRSAQHPPELTGVATLQQCHLQGLVTAALVHKVQAEGDAVLQQLQQAET
jgi:hypothetical protein